MRVAAPSASSGSCRIAPKALRRRKRGGRSIEGPEAPILHLLPVEDEDDLGSSGQTS
jgi:hypothetical protein